MRPQDTKRFSVRAWRRRRRLLRNQQLLDTGTGARVISASLTTLDASAPEPPATSRLRVW
jgi:hypothetical protein